MVNILSVDVEDWFHVLEVGSTPPLTAWEGLESRVERNFMTLLAGFEANGATATCFFVGWVAERYPHLVRAADSAGHEIASHGFAHQLIYARSREEFRNDLRRAKDVLETIAGKPVLGYRAPGFSVVKSTPWALDEIAAAGHTYDSSIFPARRGHGGLSGARIDPHVVATPTGPLVEFPISTRSVLGRRICFFGGGYLRLFPYRLIRRMARAVNAEGLPVVYYIHPREIDPRQPRLPMAPLRRFKTYVNLSTTAGKLDAITRHERVTSFRAWLDAHPAIAAAP